MIIEWECILECNYKCFYCGNGRNDMLDESIPHEQDKTKVFKFLDDIKLHYPDDELFVFGGEPFCHPFIGEIIHHMNEIGLNYIIQTNFSLTDKIRRILDNEQFEIQISLHDTEIVDIPKLIYDISDLQHIIRRIDVMYDGQQSLDLYKQVLPILDNRDILYVTPIADFNLDDVCNNHLFEFNRLKKTVIGKVYRFEKGDRSFKWERQMKGEISYKGDVCIYKDKYVLFDASLHKYTCNYRQNNNDCPNDQCFLM